MHGGALSTTEEVPTHIVVPANPQAVSTTDTLVEDHVHAADPAKLSTSVVQGASAVLEAGKLSTTEPVVDTRTAGLVPGVLSSSEVLVSASAAELDPARLALTETSIVEHHLALDTIRQLSTNPRKTARVAYYSVAAGDSWRSVAAILYGDPNGATALQQALGNPALTAGMQLTGMPSVLNYSTTVVTAAEPSYRIAQGQTWESITQVLYGTTHANAVARIGNGAAAPAFPRGPGTRRQRVRAECVRSAGRAR